jgi:hypothetical protein
VSPFCRRIVALIDAEIENGRSMLERGLDLRNYDRGRGRIEAFRMMRELVIDTDRTFDPNLDDDDELPEQPRTLAELVSDEAAA